MPSKKSFTPASVVSQSADCQEDQPAAALTEFETATAASEHTLPALAPSKKDRLIVMLRRDDGASIEELSEAFGWLPHSTRAMLTGLRKAGHAVERAKQGSVTIYRLPA